MVGSMYILISVYTLLILVGGFIGYFKAGSTPSLIAGLVSSFLLTLLTLLYRKRVYPWAGPALLIVVLALDSFFTWKFIKTLSLVPSGALSLLSTILLIIIALRIKSEK